MTSKVWKSAAACLATVGFLFGATAPTLADDASPSFSGIPQGMMPSISGQVDTPPSSSGEMSLAQQLLGTWVGWSQTAQSMEYYVVSFMGNGSYVNQITAMSYGAAMPLEVTINGTYRLETTGERTGVVTMVPENWRPREICANMNCTPLTFETVAADVNMMGDNYMVVGGAIEFHRQ